MAPAAPYLEILGLAYFFPSHVVLCKNRSENLWKVIVECFAALGLAIMTSLVWHSSLTVAGHFNASTYFIPITLCYV